MQNKPWTEEEKHFLRDHYLIYPVRILARKLHRSEGAIHTYARLLKIKKQGIIYKKPRPSHQVFLWDVQTRKS
jgi:hypothetical protein